MAVYTLKRKTIDGNLRELRHSSQHAVEVEDTFSLGSEGGAPEVADFLCEPDNVNRMEHAAEVYTKKAHELMHVKDPNAFDRDLMIRVVNIRSQRVYGCFMLPVNLFFFTIFGASVLMHDDIANVYAVESGLRTVLTKDVENVETIEDVWDWMSDTLIPTVFLQSDYKGKPHSDKTKWGRVLTYNQLTGPLYLQQVRSQKLKCAEILKEGFEGNYEDLTDMLGDMVCYPQKEDEASDEFGANGSAFHLGLPSPDEYSGGNVTLEAREAYYRSSFMPQQDGRRLRIGRPEYSSQLATASSAGKRYSALMYQNTPLDVIYEHLGYLKEREWLDAQTKELLIRGLFLNSEVGRPRLHQFELRMKFSRGGGIFSEISLETIIMEIWDSWKSWLADLFWILLLVFKTVTEFLHLKSKWKIGEFKKTVKTGWTMMQWLQIGLGVLYMMVQFYAMVVLRMRVVNRVNEVIDQQVMDVPAESNPYGQDFHEEVSTLTSLTKNFRFLTSVYLLLLFFSFFTAFKYQPRLAVVALTLQKCAVDCVHFLIVVLPTFFGFAISGVFIFGRRLEQFSSIPASTATCFKIMMEGEFDWPLLSQEHFGTTALWVTSFMIMLVILMLNMVLAIVLDVYAGVRRGSGQSESMWATIWSIGLQLYYRRDWVSAKNLQEKLLGLDKWITKEQIMQHIPELTEQQLKIVLTATRIQSELEDSEGASQTKESMKMALAEKLVIDKVNEALRELSEGTGDGSAESLDHEGWLGGLSKQMGQQNHRMLNLQWQLQKLQWQWQAMESVHGPGLNGIAEQEEVAASESGPVDRGLNSSPALGRAPISRW